MSSPRRQRGGLFGLIKGFGFHVVVWVQVMNPLDAQCNDAERTDAICVNQLKSAQEDKYIDHGLLAERPDVKIFLPFRFHVYTPEDLFAPNTYNRYLGKSIFFYNFNFNFLSILLRKIICYSILFNNDTVSNKKCC